MKFTCAFLFGILLSGSVLAQETGLQRNPYCFKEAAAQYSAYNITEQLLYVIAKHESGFNNAAINVNKDGTYDFTVMQINSRWLPVLASYGISERQLKSDICLAIKSGAWIAAQSFLKYGIPNPATETAQYWEAVGSYNAGFAPKNHQKRMVYAHRIYKVMVTLL